MGRPRCVGSSFTNYKSPKSFHSVLLPILTSDWMIPARPPLIGRWWPCLHFQLSRCGLANRLAVCATFVLFNRGSKQTNSCATPVTPLHLSAAMPVHSREKKESNHEEMEVDFPEQDGSSTDEEDTVSSSVSEDGDTSGRKIRP